MLYIPIPVIACYISVWLLILDNFVHLLFDGFSVFLKRQEDRTDISLLYLSKFSPVIFLFWKCELMPFYLVTFIILNTCQSYDTLLNMITHDLSINVHSFLVVLLEITFFDEMK